MKKVLVMAMAALFMLGMASCGNNADANKNVETNTEEVAEENVEIKDNLTIGREFLEENAKNDSVTVTESGLQYMVLKEGTGAKPGPTDEVTVHYTGRLLDGTVFDSSVDRGEPIEFNLNEVIPGWTEGLQLMEEGSKYMLYIPYDLGYGEQAVGSIPPGSTLIFEVELLEVVKRK